MSDPLRIAGPNDAPALRALLLDAYRPLKALNIAFTATQVELDQVRETVQRHTTFVLERDGQIIATASVRFPWLSDEGHLASYPFIHWFAVTPNLKRQGIGSRLLDAVEHDFLRDQLKAPAVYLATAPQHPWLADLYQRRGYQPFYRHRPRATEVVCMRKVLHPALYEALEIKEYKRFDPEAPIATGEITSQTVRSSI